jgi:hypothetical protein
MPARTLNDFFAGFFYGQIRVDPEARTAISLQKGQGKVGQIKVEGDEEKEVTVRHDNVPLKWETWNDEDSS